MPKFDIQNYWNKLWIIATFLVGILGTFLFPPSAYVANQQIFSNLGKFIAAILVGLVLVGAKIWGLKNNVGRWWWGVVVSLLLMLGFLFAYQHYTQEWTCVCDPAEKAIYLIGNDRALKEDGTYKVKSGTCQSMLMENSCMPEEVWTKESIDENRLVLGAFYLLILAFGIICMMVLIQAIYYTSGIE